jgi:very-short-patch-repair endonuclease
MLWARLRRHGVGVHFRRQHPIGGYIADFAALSHQLIVEVDGAHHDEAHDAVRDAYLARAGFRVLRVKAWMVERHISVVLDVIRAAL